MKVKDNDNAVRRVVHRVVTFLLPDGELSNWAFVGATAVAIVVSFILIILGRVSYAKTDFFLLSPNSDSPSVTPLLPPHETDAIDATLSSSVLISGTSIGSPNAPITIVIYSDFQCDLCQRFALTTEKELERVYVETGRVRFVFKHRIIYGEESMLAAQAVECATEQNKFWPYHDMLMQSQASPKVEDLSVAKLESLAQQVGLNMATFEASLKSRKYEEKVHRDDAEGRMLGVTGTPTFFINRMKGTGDKPFEAFQKVIEELLKRSAS